MQIGETEYFKIGYTSQTVQERMRGVKYYFSDIRIIDFSYCEFKYEKCLHEKFSHRQVTLNGFHEFFKLSEDEVQEVISFFHSPIKSELLGGENG
jgi:hypothetical protein